MVFVDHAAEYSVASDQAIDGHGGWPVVVVGGVLVSGLVWPVRVVVLRVLGQDLGGVVFGGRSGCGRCTRRGWCARTARRNSSRGEFVAVS